MAQVQTMHHQHQHATMLSHDRPLPSQTGCGFNARTHLALDTAAVNQNGSFEFDRVVKSGCLHKRTQRTKQWKPVYVVLRPTTLSIYRTENEDRLRHKIYLSDLTAVAQLRDPKQKRHNLFGLFTPSRNFHLQSTTPYDAREWMRLIRQGARLDEADDEELLLASPTTGCTEPWTGLQLSSPLTTSPDSDDAGGRGLFELATAAAAAVTPAKTARWHESVRGGSSSEPAGEDRLASQLAGAAAVGRSNADNRNNNNNNNNNIRQDSSGNELASFSDFSDSDVQRLNAMSLESLPVEDVAGQGALGIRDVQDDGSRQPPDTDTAKAPLAARPQSLPSASHNDPDRVIFQGRLSHLRTKGGVRQWKTGWAVLRPRNLIVYKDATEYAARLVVPLAAITHVVATDPLSRNRRYCFQAITAEKTLKFAAPDEEALVQCLGAFGCLLARRRELEARGGLEDGERI